MNGWGLDEREQTLGKEVEGRRQKRGETTGFYRLDFFSRFFSTRGNKQAPYTRAITGAVYVF